MLRFLPDSWMEGLLRPFVMMDPQAGIYFEETAPDWRFAIFIVFLAVAWWARGRRAILDAGLGSAALTLLVVLYVWTFSIGNGRYFIAGLLMVGPLLVAAWRLLPGSVGFRWTLLLGVLLLQAAVIKNDYVPNKWGLTHWVHGAGVELEDAPIRHHPATFITSTAISYSILVPRFHPQSRWANVVGQVHLLPPMPEYTRLVQLLRADLPRHLVIPIDQAHQLPDRQPATEIRRVFGEIMLPYGLSFVSAPCVLLRSRLSAEPFARDRVESGFWICPLRYDDALRQAASMAPNVNDGVRDAVAAIEQRCPRFFPPGNGSDLRVEDSTVRHYRATDTRVTVTDAGQVYFRYFRALNPTYVGTVDALLAGRFQLPCDKLPGRYRLPWQEE